MLLFREEAGKRINTGYHPNYFLRTLDFWKTRFAVSPTRPNHRGALIENGRNHNT